MIERYGILLTGVTGFLGAALFSRLNNKECFDVIGVVRRPVRSSDAANILQVGDLRRLSEWPAALKNINKDVVIHCAALAHINTGSEDQIAECRRVNVHGTINLARLSAQAGVKRFVFISSIGVNGNVSKQPFTAMSRPSPVEPYAQSKLEAEQGLWGVQQATGMEVVIIRPPLVYGSGAPGNFGNLVRWIERGVPLPLGAIYNQRSLVGIDNLIDLIIRCIDHPAAANQVFLAGDGEDLSTTELLRAVGKAMGKPARLIPVPAGLLQFGATLLGKKTTAQRLLGSLQVDISKTCELLDWKPPYTVEEGLRRCFEPVK
jgi:nucleoside-diphosphate-sugar epimerase